MFLETLIDGFLLDCRARNLSPATIERAYAPVLRDLSAWLDNPQIADITTEDLRRFVVHVRESRPFGRVTRPWVREKNKPLAAWTVRRYVQVTKRLFNWAAALRAKQ